MSGQEQLLQDTVASKQPSWSLCQSYCVWWRPPPFQTLGFSGRVFGVWFCTARVRHRGLTPTGKASSRPHLRVLMSTQTSMKANTCSWSLRTPAARLPWPWLTAYWQKKLKNKKIKLYLVYFSVKGLSVFMHPSAVVQSFPAGWKSGEEQPLPGGCGWSLSDCTWLEELIKSWGKRGKPPTVGP